MLITGTNKGLGKACANEFSDYELITVSRHEDATETGDLRDRAFLQSLVERYCPDVLINNAGVYSSEWQEQIEVNLYQAGFLATEFYQKMPAGSTIINVCSASANLSGWQNIQDADLFYTMAKAALKHLSNMLSRSKRRPVRVTSLEPAFFLTDFANIQQRWDQLKDHIPPTHYWYKQHLMTPDYLAKTIRWIIQQPANVQIASLEILNSVIE